MKSNSRLVLVVLCLAVLAACDREAPSTGQSPTAPASTAASPATPAPEQPAGPTEPTAARPAIAVPGSLADCNAVQAVSVRWNFDIAGKQVKLVDVFIGGNGNETKLFVTGPSSGDATTGPWIRPGSEFVLKDHSSNEELARFKISGPACGTP